MIDNLLFLARAETSGSFHRSHFDGRAAIEEIREFYEAVSQEQGVEIRMPRAAATSTPSRFSSAGP